MLTAAALVFILAALAFALAGAWGRRRWPLVLLYAASLASGGWLMLTLWRGPMPVRFEWRSGDAEVIATDWIEGETIWLWLRWPGDDEPRAYRLPWSKPIAEAVERGKAEAAEGEGEGLSATFPSVADIQALGARLEGLSSPYSSPSVRVGPTPRPPELPPKEEGRATPR